MDITVGHCVGTAHTRHTHIYLDRYFVLLFVHVFVAESRSESWT